MPDATTVNPYLSLLRRNRTFRLLYIGQTISQLGDWFNTVAVYALLLDLTGSATAVAWMLIVQMLPIALVGPLAGVVVDRLNRRRIMMAADLVRGSTAAGIGVLYGARGIGASLGPILLRWILGQKPATLRRAIGPSYFMIGVFYAALSAAPGLSTAAACVLLAHFGGSILWVFSTVLLQMEVPDQFRGRVFAAELALVTLTSSMSSYLTGHALDRGASPRSVSIWLGALFVVPGVVWLLILARWKDSDAPPAQPDQTTSAEEELLEGHMG